ncbi:MAG TPA: glycoside hydrolase TIM-barrel-like domain-containing protein [Thermohalobaculum sp.]|nr:glycoside hydrolase TIM-barrel-like domain-containing protein [Thermohalobaculum sp.]
MAKVLLAAAGSAVGGSIGGSVLGIGAAALGKAVGATVGSLIDQRILGSGAKAVETGRARALHLQTSTEGAPMAHVFGRMRVAGEVIWSTRFNEDVETSTQGGKSTGGQKVREYSYSISLAIGLCEGQIDGIGRIWADGKPWRPDDAVMRVYRGGESQLPDPKIEAVEGADRAPAFRGTAYVVFEDLQLGPFGNRIPQFGFEVYRSPLENLPIDPAERGERLSSLVQGVALLPGTGEFALAPEPYQYVSPDGLASYANINNSEGRPDMLVALDQLDRDLPACDAVSLVVSWFGSDLRVGQCRVEPKVEKQDRDSRPGSWSVAGLTSAGAAVVSTDGEGRPNFGGTPSDQSVIDAIRELKARGKRVLLYPFLLMDVPPGNGLPDPYGGAEQAAFPWRGRITLDAAPGMPGSSDQTAAAADEVAPFFGSARASDFAVSGDSVSYSGPAEWTWRRFVLHLAALAQAAGGVESFCVGTELRGITTIRDSRTSYPAVDALIDLTTEVRQLLPGADLSYAADWSEYFGHQPPDGSGDAIFHLDPLWAHPAIDFVGVDDYTPLSDWRYSAGHLDRAGGAPSVYSLPYLKGNVEGGEYHDFYYADLAAREAQDRSAITDGAHGEPWIYRPKDIRSWWSNSHHDRVGGVRQASPTAWQPESKPVRLTETGCPASDLGANQPNVFFDGKSSESALPYFSLGARDDEMQRRFLQAKLGHWADPAINPISGIYGGPMIADSYVWTWDLRPWPDFPLRQSVWADGPAYRIGHWINGRLTASSLAEVVAEICVRAGLSDIDVSGLYGAVHGYLIDATRTAREALQPLMLAYGFDAVESGGLLVFAMRGDRPGQALAEERLVAAKEGGPVERVRESAGTGVDAVRVAYMQSDGDYRIAAAEASLPQSAGVTVAETSLPLVLPSSNALALAERWLAESARVRDGASFVLPPSERRLEPADHVTLEFEGLPATYRIERITETERREVEATRVERSIYLPVAHDERMIEPPLTLPQGPVQAVFMDLPLANGSEIDHRPWLAVTSQPWGEVAVYRLVGSESFEFLRSVRRPATMGTLLDPLPAAAPDRWARFPARLAIRSGALQSRDRLAVLNGENRLAVELPGGEWEIVQFRDAVLTGPGEITLSTLLRGQRGTSALATGAVAAGARVVVLDEAVVPVPLARDELGLSRVYRIGPARYDFGHASYVELAHEAPGTGLRPFAPAHLRARTRTDGALDIGWVRTTRIGGDSWEAQEVPLGEDSERYRLRILAGGSEVRRVERTVPSFLYDTTMQASDGAAGEIELRVAQLSTTYGPGPERVVTADV